jgi:hypothetical protein
MVGDVVVGLLAEVVTDTGPMSQQMLDRHRVPDQRQISLEYRSCRRRERQMPRLDQAHHRQCRQALGTTGNAELALDAHGNATAAIRHPMGPEEPHGVADIDTHHTREPRPGCCRLDRDSEVVHRADSTGRPLGP